MNYFLALFWLLSVYNNPLAYEDPDPSDQPLAVGTQARVNDALALHLEPDAESEILTHLATGTIVTIIDSAPVLWWKVQTDDGVEGWAIEGVMVDEFIPLQLLIPLCPYTTNRIAFTHVTYTWESSEAEAAGMRPYSRHDIYTIDPDGQNICNLTGFSRIDQWITELAWSPDGSKIAFSYGEAIYLVDADGTDLTRLDVYGESFTWSPDSRQLAYAYRLPDTIFPSAISIYDLKTDTASEVVRSENLMNYVRWSPDGSLLAYTENNMLDETGSIRVIPPTGGTARTLIASDDNPMLYSTVEWHPDGTQLVITAGVLPAGLAVEVVALADGTRTLIAEGDVESGVEAPIWLPDGKTLLYWANVGFSDEGGQLIAEGSSEATTLISGIYQPNRYWSRLSFRPEGYVMPVSPAPDGSAAVFWGLDGVMVINLQSGEAALIAENSTYVPPRWQPSVR